MAATAQRKPRKAASQERSRLTVSALVEAAARILVREGYDKANTNRIAEVAGVSIGSLYQYFPSKEAVIVAVIARHNAEVMDAVQKELAAAFDAPVRRAISRLVRIAVKAHHVDPNLHRVLSEQIPRMGPLEKVEGFNRNYFTLFKAFLERHRDEIQVRDLDLASFICVTAIEALAHNAVLHEKIASDSAVNALVRDTERLIIGYLLR